MAPGERFHSFSKILLKFIIFPSEEKPKCQKKENNFIGFFPFFFIKMIVVDVRAFCRTTKFLFERFVFSFIF